jgi:hypothetical protein
LAISHLGASLWSTGSKEIAMPRSRIVTAVLAGSFAALAMTGSGVVWAVGDADPVPYASATTTYETVFQAPDANRAQDLTIENRAIALINATPPGERIDFAYRDFNRAPVIQALLAAKARGVLLRGVIDGGERTRPPLVPLKTAMGDDLVYCGSDVAFALHSCLADDPQFSEDGKSLQHNKFMLFSRLSDGRANVVLETSMNFLNPSQLTYFNDAVVISGDAGLYAGYLGYLLDMMRQGPMRTSDRYTGHVVTSSDTLATMYPSPRSQPDLLTNDTIAERMDEIDCTRGGTILAANQIFDVERAVIADRLVRLHEDGCDVRVLFTRADAEILATLASAGIAARPLYWEPVTASRLPQVRIHNKFWLVDARSKATGEPVKLAYVGSSNWRADEQYSDDLLLRIADDQVHDAYRAYWQVIEQRASSDLALDLSETEAPFSVARVDPPANPAGWHDDKLTLSIAASDGHRPDRNPSGVSALAVQLTGAETRSVTVTPTGPRLPAVATLTLGEEGVTTVRYHAEDAAGNAEPEHMLTIRIDRTPPVIRATGLLAARCSLWPPNGALRPVGSVVAGDGSGSGLAGPISVSAASGGTPDGTEVVVTGASATVALRAVKQDAGAERTYSVIAEAQDLAGNASALSTSCVVPHSMGKAP